MAAKNITLKANNRSADGQIEVLEFSEATRIKRGTVALVLGLLLTAISVFVPVLHIFLVPIGLIITILISPDNLYRFYV